MSEDLPDAADPLSFALHQTDPRDWAPELQKSRIYEQLLSDIILGALPPSAPLEEKRLALRYGAGLSGLREAMNRLALEGMVVRRARIGTVVAPLDLREIAHAFEVRRLLEGRSGALAAMSTGARPESRRMAVGAMSASRSANPNRQSKVEARLSWALACASSGVTRLVRATPERD